MVAETIANASLARNSVIEQQGYNRACKDIEALTDSKELKAAIRELMVDIYITAIGCSNCPLGMDVPMMAGEIVWDCLGDALCPHCGHRLNRVINGS